MLKHSLELNEYLSLSLAYELPSSVHTISKEQRAVAVRNFLHQLNVDPIYDQSVILQLKNILASKNYLLVGDGNRFALWDRESAYEDTYTQNFKYFLQRCNDKEICFPILENIIQQFLHHDYFAKENQFEFLDIGAGDGHVGAFIAGFLYERYKVQYSAIERDKKLSPQIVSKMKKLNLSHQIFSSNLEEIIPNLPTSHYNIILSCHLYPNFEMDIYLEKLLNALKQNGILILVHDTNFSDLIRFRSNFANLLQLSDRDFTQEISDFVTKCGITCITLPYHCHFDFPTLSQDDWQALINIKQADYTNTYTNFPEALFIAKNLIDFILSDRLEAFSDSEREMILMKLKDFLVERNHQFSILSKIQVISHPNASQEKKQGFTVLQGLLET